MSGVERSLLIDAFDSGWIAPAGPDLTAFEDELAASATVGSNRPHVVGVSSGTAAIHLALLAVGVGRGDRVLVSDVTFGAPAFAATYCGADLTFVDAEPGTWLIDPQLLADELAESASRRARPKAVIAVDVYGSVIDHRVREVCAEHEVALIEDAAEAFGSTRDGQPAGTLGDIGVWSFNGNKILTTGGGGALVSADPHVAQRARHLATQAKRPGPVFDHDDIGYNYRLSNLAAAVGRGQLRTLPERIAARQTVHDRYRSRLGAVPGIYFQTIPDGVTWNAWLTTIEIDPDQFGARSADVLALLHAAGIEARPGFKPMHRQDVFAGFRRIGRPMSVADQHFARSVCLPSSGRLTALDVDMIADIIVGAPSHTRRG